MLRTYVHKMFTRFATLNPMCTKITQVYTRYATLKLWKKFGRRVLGNTGIKLIEDRKTTTTICKILNLPIVGDDSSLVLCYTEKDGLIHPVIYTTFNTDASKMSRLQLAILTHEAAHIDDMIENITIFQNTEHAELSADRRAAAVFGAAEYAEVVAPILIEATNAFIDRKIFDAARTNIRRLRQLATWSNKVDFVTIDATLSRKLTEAELSGK